MANLAITTLIFMSVILLTLSVSKINRRYPTDFLHCIFSAIVYDQQTVGTTPNASGISDHYNGFLQGWRVHSIKEDKENGNYYGVIFVNAEKSQLVLAHRGTAFNNLWKDLLNSNTAIGTDIYGVLEGQFVGQELAAALFTEEAVKISERENYVFSAT